MKLAGDYIIFGEGALDYLKTLKGKKAFIVISGGSIEKSGYLKIIQDNLSEAGIESTVFKGVEPDPSIQTVLKGAKAMLEFEPDWIIGVGGGSAMDAAKIESYETVGTIPGSDLEHITYKHPFLDRISPIIL